MKRAWNELERGLEWCGALVLTAVGLPLLVLATVLLRGVLLGAAMVAVIGSIALFCGCARFRGWVKRI